MGSLSRMMGVTADAFQVFLAEADSLGFASLERQGGGDDARVTLKSRRLARDAARKKANAERQLRYVERRAARTADAPVDARMTVQPEFALAPPQTNTKPRPRVAAPAPPPAPAVIEIPLIPKDGSYPVSQAQVDEWTLAYPGVDVLAELRKVVAWCRANPTKRKTRRGAARFLNLWLSKAQDRPPQARVPAAGVPISGSSIFDQPMQLPNKRAFDGQ